MAIKRKILLVAIIVVSLALFLFPVLIHDAGGKSGTTRIRISSLCTALDTFEVDTGHYPPKLESLWIREAETNWNGPYLKSENAVFDEWTNRFSYHVHGELYDLISAGQDGVFGTFDDITN